MEDFDLPPTRRVFGPGNRLYLVRDVRKNVLSKIYYENIGSALVAAMFLNMEISPVEDSQMTVENVYRMFGSAFIPDYNFPKLDEFVVAEYIVVDPIPYYHQFFLEANEKFRRTVEEDRGSAMYVPISDESVLLGSDFQEFVRVNRVDDEGFPNFRAYTVKVCDLRAHTRSPVTSG